jgi:hypothetical protein
MEIISELTESIHAKLMNEAYKWWNSKSFENGYDWFIENLPREDWRAAVLLGNLNYQVENGGFEQWHYNGYVSQYERLRKYLEQVDCEVLRLLNAFMVLVEKGLLDEDRVEFDEETAHTLCLALDCTYYSRNQKFLDSCNQFLANMKK